MTDPAESPAYRHPQVYHTMRGSMLSSGRGFAGPVAAALLSEPAAVKETEAAHDDAAGLYELRRYSEPND